MFVNEYGGKKPFEWCTRKGLSQVSENSMSDMVREQPLNLREGEIYDKAGHFDLKYDLVDHIWSNWGLNYDLQRE